MVQYAAVGTIQLAYQIAGSGPPLLLLHGGEADHAMFNEVIGPLGRAFRTIAYDQRDCGASLWTPGTPYDLADLADEAAGLIAALGYERCHVLGHSAGGLVAQLLAIRWPEKVDRLILEATMSPLMTAENFDGEELKERQRMVDEGDDHGFATLFSTPEYVAANPEFVAHLKELRGRQTPEQNARRHGAIRSVPAMDYSKLVAKTLVFAGERDKIVPLPMARALADMIPDASLEIFPGVGHVGIFQDIDRFVDVVTAFLKEG